MIRPSQKEAKQFFNDYTVIPICKELFADIRTTVEILRIFMAENKKCYLLESVESGENWGRYSFLGCDPKLTIRCYDSKVFIDKEGERGEIVTENPLTVLRNVIYTYKSPQIDYMPPFTGGLAGYFSYDFIKYTERSLNLSNLNNEGFDDFYLMLFDTVIAFDHLKQKIFIIVNVSVKDFEINFIKAELKLNEIENLIRNGIMRKYEKSELKSDFKILHNKKEFMNMVVKVKKYISEGDVFQAVISNIAEATFKGNLVQAYRVLRTINPSPYMFYFNFGDVEIAGASPETLVKLQDKKLYTFPLAGTRPRGKDDAEDKKFEEDLLSDEKELAEHNMLVDLGRNDLGRVAEIGSVKLEKYLNIERFSHVMHIGSTVTGKLKEDKDFLDVINAILPAGTLSGAPKIRACEIINELENNKRGIYGGAIGYISLSGNVDTCISIRMAFAKENKVFIRSGAGIVADSIPELEFEECMNKAKAVLNALKLATSIEQ